MTITNSFPVITPIPAFNDNYIWAIQTSPGHCAVIDPGDSTPVFDWLEANKLQLDSILITHHHMDHIGGVNALVERTGATVLAPADTRLPDYYQTVDENSKINLNGLPFEVLAVPGHTLSHIAFYSAQAALLFCGDALFSMGCGRMFEGKPAQMLASLDKLAALPDSTLIYCTHEYTIANGRFARAVEPDNQAVAQRCKEVAELRNLNQPTLPISLASEMHTNPFLRCDQADVISAAQRMDPSAQNRIEVFAALRRWKDSF